MVSHDCKGKVKYAAFEPKWLIRPALISGFCSIKQLGVFQIPPASPSQGYPSIKFASTHLYTLVERGTESKVSYPRTQHNVPGLGPVSQKSR